MKFKRIFYLSLAILLNITCLKQNPSSIQSTETILGVLEKIEFIKNFIEYYKSGSDIDSILIKSNVNQVTASNGVEVYKKIIFSEDSSKATIILSGSGIVPRKAEIILRRRDIYSIRTDVDTAYIIGIYNNFILDDASPYIPNTVSMIANFGADDNIERVKDANLELWYLKNIDVPYTIPVKYFNKLEKLAIELIKRLDPQYELQLLNAGSWDAYLYGVSPSTGFPLYLTKQPVDIFVNILSVAKYKGETKEERGFIATQMLEWLKENRFIK